MNSNQDNPDDKKLNPRLAQDNAERRNAAYSRGVFVVLIVVVLALLSYFYFQTNDAPVASEPGPDSTIIETTPSVINTTPTPAPMDTVTPPSTTDTVVAPAQDAPAATDTTTPDAPAASDTTTPPADSNAAPTTMAPDNTGSTTTTQ